MFYLQQIRINHPVVSNQCKSDCMPEHYYKRINYYGMLTKLIFVKRTALP